MQKSIIYFLSIFTVVGLIACNSNAIKKTKTGIEYKFFTDVEGKTPKKGDCINCTIVYKTQKDSILGNRENYRFIVMGDSADGSLDEGIIMMSPGDSAMFSISADTIFTKAGQPLPEVFKKGDKMKFFVKFHSFIDEQTENKELADFLKAKNITTTPQPSGLFYMETLAGTGNTPVDGDTVYVNYVGKFLDGKVFDESASHGAPISFPLGIGAVVPGWEEAIKLMHPGCKANVILPSKIAYGKMGNYGIPPYASLYFEMELVKVVKGATQKDSSAVGMK